MSTIYQQLNKSGIEAATKKARDVKPKVHISGYNDFLVAGSAGTTYRVSFSGSKENFVSNCTCIASLSGKVCYHVAACAPIFKQQTIELRAALELDEWLEKYETECAGCGQLFDIDVVSDEGNCKVCQLAKDDADLFG